MLNLFEYPVMVDGEIEFFGWDATNKIAYLFGGSLQIEYDKNTSYLEALDDLKKYYNDYRQQDLQLSMLANYD